MEVVFPTNCRIIDSKKKLIADIFNIKIADNLLGE